MRWIPKIKPLNAGPFDLAAGVHSNHVSIHDNLKQNAPVIAWTAALRGVDCISDELRDIQLMVDQLIEKSDRMMTGILPQDIYIASSFATKIHCWYFVKPGAKYIVLLSRGSGGNMTWRAELLEMMLNSGQSVFTYDYQGYGRSEGNPNLWNMCEDSEAAYKYIRDEIFAVLFCCSTNASFCFLPSCFKEYSQDMAAFLLSNCQDESSVTGLRERVYFAPEPEL